MVGWRVERGISRTERGREGDRLRKEERAPWITEDMVRRCVTFSDVSWTEVGCG